MKIKKQRHRMYAVSAKGFGILAGTLAYSRREAIEKWVAALPANSFGHDWAAARNAGYRTVCAVLETVHPLFGRRRTTKVRS